MLASVALTCSVLALFIALWTWRKVRQVERVYEEQTAASLEVLLDEWEKENRRFIADLERLHRQWTQQVETAAGSVCDKSVLSRGAVDDESPPVASAETPATSTFQKLLEEVLALKKAGKSDSEIARHMNRGVGEIQFILQSAAFQKKNRS